MERQRKKHPRAPPNVPRQWREFERFVGPPIEMAAEPGTDEQQTFRCLGIEPHKSWCNLASLNEDIMK